eukprot:6313287-Alexandrium_andersonii.AAC.1
MWRRSSHSRGFGGDPEPVPDLFVCFGSIRAGACSDNSGAVAAGSGVVLGHGRGWRCPGACRASGGGGARAQGGDRAVARHLASVLVRSLQQREPLVQQ